jgi:PadR family transcriptional regulator PadR
VDIQLKRGLLEACVLAVLVRGDSYGYQMIKDISQCIEISESTLYPILKRLEAGEMLTVYSSEHNGRLRKYYRITESGRQKIKSFKDEWKEVTAVYNFIKDAEESVNDEQA